MRREAVLLSAGLLVGALCAHGCGSSEVGHQSVDVTSDVASEHDGHGGGHGDGHGGGHGGGHHDADHTPPDPAGAEAGEEIFRAQCAGCHTLGLGETTRGPDLLTANLRPDGWLRRWLADPAGWAAQNPYAAKIVQQWGRQMPNPGLDDAQIEQVIAFIRAQRASGAPLEPRPPRALDEEGLERANALYFNRCAGCHGTQRGGAIGPDLRPERAEALGSDLLGATIRHGTPWGMPSWGASGVLSEDEIAELVALLQRDVPPAPELTLQDILASWQVLIAPEDRPDAPEHSGEWTNWFGVVQRDTGEVVILDGATRDEIGRIDVGFATHILRASSTGRYFYAVGRDGWLTMVDLWSSAPTVVARARGCFDARSVEGSKYPGFEERYLVQGCYWPSQYVVFDGETLEPLAAHSVLGPAVGETEPLTEVRVASIVASPYEPVWVLALKESGHLGIVDYTQPDFPLVERLDGERLLHDGGWDATHRYFIAASALGQLVVTDVKERSVVARIPTGALPHPGRGANWVDPAYGPVNATVHLGEGLLLVYGADPDGHPEQAWKEVRRVTLPSAGSLFLKTHDASPWVLMDMALSDDPALARQVCAYDKASGTLDRCFEVADAGRAVHIEFDATGATFWVSVWDHHGEVAVFDAVTLEEIDRVAGLDAPTGKFNVHNTAHDIY